MHLFETKKVGSNVDLFSMLNGLDLFSGIGGLTLALQPWVRPIAYCENDRYAQAVLLSRMWSGHIGRAPIWDDVRTLHAEQIEIPIDIVYGGFPCQDISAAGARAGMGGERSGLFQHIARLVSETNPQFVFLENVPAIRTRGLNSVCQTFTELGYDCRWTVVSAAEVGAPHLRKRWFLLAHAAGENVRHEPGRRARAQGESAAVTRHDGAQESLAHAAGTIEPRHRHEQSGEQSGSTDASWWAIEPELGRVAYGVPSRVERLRGLGNSVVPAQAREAFMRLMVTK